jgi:hypothetical protein
MSDTPLTDKEVNISAWLGSGPLVHAEFARKLERDVYEAEREIKDLTIRSQQAEKDKQEALTKLKQALRYLDGISDDCNSWLLGDIEEPSVEFIKLMRDYARKGLNA